MLEFIFLISVYVESSTMEQVQVPNLIECNLAAAITAEQAKEESLHFCVTLKVPTPHKA